MGSTINTNIASLNAQRNLTTSQSALATSLQRLSSGMRINSAKDDAAGLAISERFSTQIRGLNQAIRNANDGTSLAQTGEAALAEVTNNLQRIRELAVQSTNSTNSTSDRAAIDLEVQQRLAEIDRSASQTSFNGQKILDGSFGLGTFQVGANAGETISVNLDSSVSMRTAAVGAIATTKSTSSITGADATGGSLVVANSNLSFGTGPGTATAGFVSLTPTGDYDFRAISSAVAGASTVQTIGGVFNFGTAGSLQVDNSNIQSMTTALGASAANVGGALTVGGTYGATVTVDGQAVVLASADYTVAGALQTALNLGLTDITATVDDGTGAVSFVRTDPGNTKAIAVSADATAQANGWQASVAGVGTINQSVFDFATGGAGAMGQFIVDAGASQVTVSLDQDYGDGDVGGAAMADDVQTQLRAALGANLNYAASYDTVAKSLVITKAGAASGVDISTMDPNAIAAGIATQAGSGYQAAQPTTNATLTVDGADLTLTAGTDRATLITELNKQIQAAAGGTTLGDDKANYLAVASGVSGIQIQRTGSTVAVVISNVDSKAAAVGFANSTGVTGDVALATSKKATFTIDGAKTIVLNANYGGINGLQGAILDQLTTQGGGYTVTNTGGAITIKRTTTGAGSAAVNITAGKTGVDAAGAGGADGLASLGNAGATKDGTIGTDAGAVTNASFKVDGSIVNLTANYTSLDTLNDATSLAAALRTKLAGYSVAVSGSNVTITNNTMGSAAVAITDNAAATSIEQTNAHNAGFLVGAGTAGTQGGQVTIGANTLTITAGTGAAVSMAGTYTSSQKLADAINANVSGVYASIGGAGADSGKLILSSASDFTLAGGGANLTAASYAANYGSLATVDVKTVANANTAINAVDSALARVSTLRSTFGAVQNRFDSVISSLSSTSENLSAARSRIVDTDFASETANLTRNQILQQAGTAMLAQANALPQSVLSLLK